MNNTPTLMQSEEKRAPWNEKTKKITVDISVSMSTSCEIEVPIDFDESDNKALESYVEEQIYLPQDLMKSSYLLKRWVIDDFCVL